MLGDLTTPQIRVTGWLPSWLSAVPGGVAVFNQTKNLPHLTHFGNVFC